MEILKLGWFIFKQKRVNVRDRYSQLSNGQSGAPAAISQPILTGFVGALQKGESKHESQRLGCRRHDGADDPDHLQSGDKRRQSRHVGVTRGAAALDAGSAVGRAVGRCGLRENAWTRDAGELGFGGLGFGGL